MDINSVFVAKVIIVRHGIGSGDKDNPFRTVLDIYTQDGMLIARNDPFDLNNKNSPIEQIWPSLIGSKKQ